MSRLTFDELRDPPLEEAKTWGVLRDRWQDHCVAVHDVGDETFGNDVIGWHRTAHPDCHKSIFVDGEPWWTAAVIKR